MPKLTADYDTKVWAHYQAAAKVARLLTKAGFEAYLIGGAVRDILTSRLPRDFDLVTNATPEQIIKLPGLAQAKYTDPAQAFGISRLKVPINIRGKEYTSEVEVATYRRDIESHLGRKLTKIEYANLEDDIKRRDFTINALALDLANDYLVDLVGGLEDLSAGLVRFIGLPADRITEDPLRVLRGIRLKVQYGFEYTDDTQGAIITAIKGGAIQRIATERTRDELTRMLVHHTRRAAFEELDVLGALKSLLPELLSAKGIKQPMELHAEGDVWMHTLIAIESLPPVVNPRLAWATLLHDIGKPPTFVDKAPGADRIRFSEHYKVGAEMARVILGRLKFSKRFVEDVCWMINHHIGIDDLPKMRPGRARQFMGHSAFKDLLELHKADAKATWHLLPSGKIDVPEPEFKILNELYEEFLAQKHTRAPSLKHDLGIDGSWLKKEYHLDDSPQLGELLAKLTEAYLDEEIEDEPSARRMIEEYLKSRPS